LIDDFFGIKILGNWQLDNYAVNIFVVVQKVNHFQNLFFDHGGAEFFAAKKAMKKNADFFTNPFFFFYINTTRSLTVD